MRPDEPREALRGEELEQFLQEREQSFSDDDCIDPLYDRRAAYGTEVYERGRSDDLGFGL